MRSGGVGLSSVAVLALKLCEVQLVAEHISVEEGNVGRPEGW